MDYQDAPHQSQRETYITFLLCLIVGAPIFVFFMVITGGLFILLLIMTGAIAALASLHYLLWGRSFDRQVVGEREEEELRASSEEWLDDDPRGYRSM
jgi:hypothetical protein